MATHRHWLLLLFLPWALLSRRGAQPPDALYPVVLLPGNTCSQLEARLTDAYEPPPESPQCGAGSNERGRWFRLWRNATAMDDPAVAPCLADQLRVVYDPAARDFRNEPGVETRVLGFGSTADFLADTEANNQTCVPTSETSAWGGSSRRCSRPGTATERRCSARRTTSARLPRRGGSRAVPSRGSPGGSGRSWSAPAGRTAAGPSSSCRTARAATSRWSSCSPCGTSRPCPATRWRPPTRSWRCRRRRCSVPARRRWSSRAPGTTRRGTSRSSWRRSECPRSGSRCTRRGRSPCSSASGRRWCPRPASTASASPRWSSSCTGTATSARRRRWCTATAMDSYPWRA
uniref:Lecithin-cholesterol acyltransferase-like 1 n=1 Tax=Zea mays TaxID=4577 RepID=A0A804MY52_MAIZE